MKLNFHCSVFLHICNHFIINRLQNQSKNRDLLYIFQFLQRYFPTQDLMQNPIFFYVHFSSLSAIFRFAASKTNNMYIFVFSLL